MNVEPNTLTPETSQQAAASAWPRLLVAPDSFKGTYTALEVANAIASGSHSEVDICPLADGGENTLAVLVAAAGGFRTSLVVHDPLGRPVTAELGWIDSGTTAVVESALASGLGLVTKAERRAEVASSAGTGELIAAAAAAGARRIVVGLGGSACTDGGAGAIEAIERAGGIGEAEVVALCDVTTAFEDAARLYGPQKGADQATVELLEKRLDTYASALPRDPRGIPRTGAAGGLSGALWAAYDAQLVSGAGWILDAVGFNERVVQADLVITGEGSFDRQTLEGKLVFEVAMRCRRAGVPLCVVAGRSTLSETEATAMGVTSLHIASDTDELALVGSLLTETKTKELNSQ